MQQLACADKGTYYVLGAGDAYAKEVVPSFGDASSLEHGSSGAWLGGSFGHGYKDHL